MSKNTSSSAFRKIDVDQFNEDNYRDEDVDTAATGLGPTENEINNMLSTGQNSEALKKLLANAPIGNKNQSIKVRDDFP